MNVPEQPQSPVDPPVRHTGAGDLALAAVLITAAQYAHDQPHQPLQAASPEEVAFLADHIKPMVDGMGRHFSPERVEQMIQGLQGASQAAIVDGLDIQDYLDLMDHLGNIRAALNCLARQADEAIRVAYRLYMADRPQDAAGGEQGGGEQGSESPPAAASP